jgi:hypothetical protein
MRCRVAMSAQVPCGKHRQKSFEQVACEDRRYCAWVLRDNPIAFRSFGEYLRRTYGGVLCIGRHKGKFFSEVCVEDPDYCRWVSELEEPSQPMKEFASYVAGRSAESQEEPPHKKAHTAEPYECKICFASRACIAMIPCGHVLCPCCSTRIADLCPFCRVPFERTIRLFV